MDILGLECNVFWVVSFYLGVRVSRNSIHLSSQVSRIDGMFHKFFSILSVSVNLESLLKSWPVWDKYSSIRSLL